MARTDLDGTALLMLPTYVGGPHTRWTVYEPHWWQLWRWARLLWLRRNGRAGSVEMMRRLGERVEVRVVGRGE